MKIPHNPPNHYATIASFFDRRQFNADAWNELFRFMGDARPTDEKGRYLHWDDFRFRPFPPGINIETFWAFVRRAREQAAHKTPFADKNGVAFSYVLIDFINRALHEIDSGAHGGLGFSGQAPAESSANQFLIRSLVEEPFNSSLLEGAATTREQAKRLIEQNVQPKTIGERMVLNNHRAIEFIKQQKHNPLTIEIIHELHRILTHETDVRPERIGCFREESDDVNVVDDTTSEVLHAPPHASLLSTRVQKICDFANGADKRAFVHPILKAIILHFMLAYDHPYVDGNGRTARALFYWAVVRDGYWLLEYISISRIINKAPVKYGTAFLHTETDQADLTYFLVHQLQVVLEALSDLNDYIYDKRRETAKLKSAVSAAYSNYALNYRQLALLTEAVADLSRKYTIDVHSEIHRVSYLTARADLEELHKMGLLSKSKRKNKSIYRPDKEIAAKLQSFAPASDRLNMSLLNS